MSEHETQTQAASLRGRIDLLKVLTDRYVRERHDCRLRFNYVALECHCIDGTMTWVDIGDLEGVEAFVRESNPAKVEIYRGVHEDGSELFCAIEMAWKETAGRVQAEADLVIRKAQA